MAISVEQTKVLVGVVLGVEQKLARAVLHDELISINSNEPEFYESVIKHVRSMPFTSEEWFDFLAKIPTHVLRRERELMNKLSESQRQRLPPATLG